MANLISILYFETAISVYTDLLLGGCRHCVNHDCHNSLANWLTKFLVMLVKFELCPDKYSDVADFQD